MSAYDAITDLDYEIMNRVVYVSAIVFFQLYISACSGLSNQRQIDNLYLEQQRAHAGDLDAQLAIANRYRDGDSVTMDIVTALSWYLQAADQNSPEGAFEAATILLEDLDQGNDRQAESLLLMAVEADFAPAQYRYAQLLDARPNHQNPESLSRIFELYLAAANAGMPDAQYETANRLASGRGVPLNTRLAFGWYQRSADQGNAKAQLALGDYYLVGLGIPADLHFALQWYEKSATQGSVRAQSNLGDLLTYDRYAAVNDFVTGAQWYRDAADQGYAHAQSRLGQLYEFGFGVPKNLEVAAQWYRSAADQGLASAQCRLGSLYLRGAGVNQSSTDAIRLFNQAAAQVPAGVMPLLGVIYYDCTQFDNSKINIDVPPPTKPPPAL